MIHLLPTLRWPWQRRTPTAPPEPVTTPRTPDWWDSVQPDLRRRVIAARVPSCWNCGHPGISFCETACDTPLIVKAPQPWKVAVPFPVHIPDAAEIAEDARLAAALDAEAAA